MAPASAQSTMGPPYQSTMNGMEPLGWWDAKTAAPNAPATSPAIAPVRCKLVGAPLRNAQINKAKGAMAKSGMQYRQVTHCVPRIIGCQAAEGSSASATMPANPAARNGRKINVKSFRPSWPGRINLISKAVPTLTKLSMNRTFNARKPKWDTPLASVRRPTVASITQKEAAPPIDSAQTNGFQTCPLLTGSMFVLSMSINWSVFMIVSVLTDLERKGF